MLKILHFTATQEKDFGDLSSYDQTFTLLTPNSHGKCNIQEHSTWLNYLQVRACNRTSLQHLTETSASEGKEK